MKKTDDNGIPEFQSLEEEKEYWEARGPLAEGNKGTVNKPRPGQKRSSFLAVRLTGEELTRLRDIAEKRGMGPSTFARHILAEAIEKSANASDAKTLGDVIHAFEENLSQDKKEGFSAILRAFDERARPIRLTLNDKKDRDEFAHFSAALLLWVWGAQVTSESEEQKEAKRLVKVRS